MHYEIINNHYTYLSDNYVFRGTWHRLIARRWTQYAGHQLMREIVHATSPASGPTRRTAILCRPSTTVAIYLVLNIKKNIKCINIPDCHIKLIRVKKETI